ncbi:hypothetical protein DYI20_09595 [Auritidibacter ignavus]|uniref:hypothetical protein n=1 Tax=Auritidibacter ignavus TaxID=678932 RepID=UPI000F032ABE|nr:hypothetical protein [Auritidibacter ignavus]RMX22445.1 hypothetical protein DYI20_09595 [Auritidibacter ignavus]
MALTGSHHEHSLTTSLTRYFVGFALLSLILTGCGGSEVPEATDASSTAPTDAPEASESSTETAGTSPSQSLSSEEASEESSKAPEPDIESLEETDFSSIDFHFSGYSPSDQTTELSLHEGRLELDGEGTQHVTPVFELGDVIHQDLTGNGIVDAAVEIKRYEGNAYDIRWSMWIATEDGPEQSPVPFARSAHCGDVVADVTPVDGGLEVHEFLRYPSDEAPCSDPGSGEQTRVVRAEYVEGLHEWWPVRTDPYPAFGGVCHAPRGGEGYPVSTHQTYVAPDDMSAPLSERAPTLNEFPEETGEVMVLGSYEPNIPHDKLWPGWVSVIIKGDQGNLGCAWTPVEE